MNRALGILSVAILALMNATIAWSDEVDSSWNRFLDNKYNEEIAYDIVVNPCGNTPCVTGVTRTADFPVTAGAYDDTYNYDGDIFITKFNSTGSEFIYSTFLGGGDDDIAYALAMDDSGNVYLTGETLSWAYFPTTPGAFDESPNPGYDAFITKINVTGSQLLYSTFLGGDKSDKGYGIDIDEFGSAYVTGRTCSANFPTTTGTFDTTFNGGSTMYDGSDIFVVKINSSGSALEYSTFIGGSGDEAGCAIVTFGRSGRVFLTGHTTSADFPVTENSFDTTYHGDHDLVLFSLDAFGKRLDYSTFLGGAGYDIGNSIAVDRFGCSYVVGFSASETFPVTQDVFDQTHNGQNDVILFKMDPTGKHLIYSTFLGGDKSDEGNSIAIDKSGYSYIAGLTYSSNFPTTNGAFDTVYSGYGAAFICKIAPSGRVLSYSTYLKGSSKAYAIDIDQYNQAYITGWTDATDFPTTSGAFDTRMGGWEDAFVTKLNATGNSLIFSTFLGGTWIDTEAPEIPLAQCPNTFTLHPNYPNPFNARTEIRYQLPEAADVSLRIYNVAGQTVRTLAESYQPTGQYTVAWDGNDDAHQRAASGIYFCRLQAGDAAETIKMALVR